MLQYGEMNIDPPVVFLRLCHEVYHVTPERLATALIYGFCQHPPRELILVHVEDRGESSVHLEVEAL